VTAAGPKPPVDAERLRRQFPALTDDDLAAYLEVTRRILAAAPDARPRITREALTGGRQAREKAARGETLSAADALLARYVDAMGKMQGRVSR